MTGFSNISGISNSAYINLDKTQEKDSEPMTNLKAKISESLKNDGKIDSGEMSEILSKALENDNLIDKSELKMLNSALIHSKQKLTDLEVNSPNEFKFEFGLKSNGLDDSAQYTKLKTYEQSKNENKLSPIKNSKVIYNPKSEINQKFGVITDNKDIIKNSKLDLDKLESSINNFSKIKSNLKTNIKDPGLYKESLVYLKTISDENNGKIPEKLIQPLNELFSNVSEYKNLVAEFKKPLQDKLNIGESIVVSALHDIAEPKDINQGNLGTCGAACVQFKLAKSNPEKYLNIIGKLSSNKDFNEMPLNKSFIGELSVSEDKSIFLSSGRSITSAIFQNSTTDFVNGDIPYDSSKKQNGDLSNIQIANIENLVIGNKVSNFSISDYSPDQLMKKLDENLIKSEGPILAGFEYSESGRDASHEIAVLELDKSKNEITFMNPQGQVEVVSNSEFKSRMTGIIGVGNEKTEDNNEYQKLFSEIKNNPEQINKTLNSDKGKNFLNSLNLEQKITLFNSVSEPVINGLKKKEEFGAAFQSENFLEAIKDLTSLIEDGNENSKSIDTILSSLMFNDELGGGQKQNITKNFMKEIIDQVLNQPQNADTENYAINYFLIASVATGKTENVDKAIQSIDMISK